MVERTQYRYKAIKAPQLISAMTFAINLVSWTLVGDTLEPEVVVYAIICFKQCCSLISDDGDDHAAADSLFLSGKHLLFDNEEDCSAAIDDCEVTYQQGDYNLNPDEDDHIVDDGPILNFSPKNLKYQPVDMSTQPRASLDKAWAGVFKQYKHKYKLATNIVSHGRFAHRIYSVNRLT